MRSPTASIVSRDGLFATEAIAAGAVPVVAFFGFSLPRLRIVSQSRKRCVYGVEESIATIVFDRPVKDRLLRQPLAFRKVAQRL